MLKKKQFKLVADTFQLKVFLQEGLLKIRLDDKIEFITYGRSYTEDDIGQQIHRKMDIQDVYYSLSKPVDNTQSQNKQGQEREVKQIETYYFDNIVRFGQNPCFKIQTGGIITVYKEYYDEYRSKKIVYESILCLDKIKDLGEKGQIRKLNQQLWQVKKENDILKEILSLSQQRIQKLEQLLKQEAIKNQNEVEKHQQMNKLIEKNKQSTQILQKEWKRIQILKGLPFPNMHHYTISINNIITFITNWGDWVHYIFNDVIPYGQTYSFKLNIIKLTQKSIMVGVCDYEKQKITYSSYGSGNAVCYYGANGFRCPDGQIQGTGLEEKETVEVIVNLSEKSIRWLVNGYERSSFTHEILGDASRKFYPYFELKNQYDSVEWMPK